MDSREGLERQGGPLRPTVRPVSRNLAFTSIGGVPPSLSSRGTVAQPAQPTQHSPCAPRLAKSAKKDRGPNWALQEVLTLIEAKRDIYLKELDIQDGCDLMIPESTKWHRISQYVMAVDFSSCLRDGVACKTKWNQLVPDYKKLADYSSRTGQDVSDYWKLTAAERKLQGLPRQFAKDFFVAIKDWFGNRPQIQPPHIRNLLSPSDANFQGSQQGQ